ncbi:hypothetical protein ECP02994389_0395 [Escherichia coli P0299438.9]|nr:hypothetical protein ECP02994389_0395 [Escherichia coli P0299438.9]
MYVLLWGGQSVYAASGMNKAHFVKNLTYFLIQGITAKPTPSYPT